MHRTRSNSQATPHPASKPEDHLLRAQEAAAILAVSPRMIWRLRAEGRLPSVSLGGATRFRFSDVRRLVEGGGR